MITELLYIKEKIKLQQMQVETAICKNAVLLIIKCARHYIVSGGSRKADIFLSDINRSIGTSNREKVLFFYKYWLKGDLYFKNLVQICF